MLNLGHRKLLKYMSLKIGSKKWKSLIKKYRYYKKTLSIWTFNEDVDQQVCQIININSQCTVMSVSILYLEVCFYFVPLCLFLFCTAMSVSILYRDVCFYFVPWCLFLFCTVMSVSIRVPSKAPVVCLDKKLHCLVLVGSRNRFAHDFTIKLK